jgi:hypothetical protein
MPAMSADVALHSFMALPLLAAVVCADSLVTCIKLPADCPHNACERLAEYIEPNPNQGAS